MTAAPPLIERILDRLHNVQPSGNGWSARCPGHRDRQNYLSVGEGDDGRALLCCHVGCEPEAIVKALSLEMRDLFPDDGQGERGGAYPPNNTATLQGLTVEEYAEAKRLPLEFLTSIGLQTITYLGRKAVRMPYFAPDGAEAAVRIRVANEGDKFRWRKGSKPCMYGLSRLVGAQAAGQIAMVEGESDCHTLWHHGIAAVGLPGAGTWKEERDVPLLEGFDTIYVVVEPDQGGEAVKKWLSTSGIRHRVRVVDLGKHGDPSGLFLDDTARFRVRWQAATMAAIPWMVFETEAASEEKLNAWSECEHLATQQDILAHFVDDLTATGLVGETRTAKLLFLAVCSRFLNRPISVAVKGPSSGGKSFLVESALRFFPDDAYYGLTAMSERALAYSEEPLKHRFLVICEAVGLSGDFASYLIRSLLSEGRLRYEVVEKTRDGLKPRLIEREGPTGLLVTTTALRLHPENETRLVSVTVTDTPDQTRAVFEALARTEPRGPDMGRWHALQVWLAHSSHEVVVSFAQALAHLVPPVAVRLRRDFHTLLNLVRAHAMLHQATRERAPDGHIVATLGDYAAVRGIVGGFMAEGVEATVPDTIRETVRHVSSLRDGGHETVSFPDLCKSMNLDRSVVSRRVRAAMDRGYLRNLETKKGQTAKLVVGDPMPDELEILPSPEAIEGVLHPCSVVRGDNTPPSPPIGATGRNRAVWRPSSCDRRRPWEVVLPRASAGIGELMVRTFHPVAGFFPLMEGADFEAQAADVEAHGLREPIWLHRDGRIIDGRNRFRACEATGRDLKTQTYIGPDSGLVDFVISLNLRRRHLNESQRAMVAAKLANMPSHRPSGDNRANLHSSSDAADLLNVSERTVKTARRVHDLGIPELIDAVDAGDIAVSDAAAIADEPDDQQHQLLDTVKAGEAKNLKAAKRKRDIQIQRDAIEAGEVKLPEGVFEVIAIDPPWPYGTSDQYDSDGFRGGTPYPEESIEELAAREIPAAANCVLWLWVTHKFMRHAFTLLDAWGFKEVATLTWVKDRMGTGRWLRSKTEFVIMAVKGRPKVDLTNQTTVIQAPRREHSRKPEEFYELVESLCIGRKLDCFSRESRPGWSQFGNEPQKFDGAA